MLPPRRSGPTGPWASPPLGSPPHRLSRRRRRLKSRSLLFRFVAWAEENNSVYIAGKALRKGLTQITSSSSNALRVLFCCLPSKLVSNFGRLSARKTSQPWRPLPNRLAEDKVTWLDAQWDQVGVNTALAEKDVLKFNDHSKQCTTAFGRMWSRDLSRNACVLNQYGKNLWSYNLWRWIYEDSSFNLHRSFLVRRSLPKCMCR